MQRIFNVIDRGTSLVKVASNVRESLSYIGFVRPSESVTEEQAKQINSEHYAKS